MIAIFNCFNSSQLADTFFYTGKQREGLALFGIIDIFNASTSVFHGLKIKIRLRNLIVRIFTFCVLNKISYYLIY